jgi:hypothetical protein
MDKSYLLGFLETQMDKAKVSALPGKNSRPLYTKAAFSHPALFCRVVAQDGIKGKVRADHLDVQLATAAGFEGASPRQIRRRGQQKEECHV